MNDEEKNEKVESDLTQQDWDEITELMRLMAFRRDERMNLRTMLRQPEHVPGFIGMGEN